MTEKTITNAITTIPTDKVVSMAIADLKNIMGIVATLRDSVLQQGVDFGPIPGTDKSVLLLPGMEKLMRALKAVPRYTAERVIVDYDKPLFHYEYRCELYDAETGTRIPGGEAIGLCTSMESKYRWREAKRKCPVCGKETIIKGKKEYGGGWLCFGKMGGCGAKFPDGDKDIEDQTTGRVENEDIYDQINTLCKMAQKRALGSAIKGAAGVSEFFTVDLEDQPAYANVVEGTFERVPDPEPPPTPPTPPSSPTPPAKPDLAVVERTDITPVVEQQQLPKAAGAEDDDPLAHIRLPNGGEVHAKKKNSDDDVRERLGNGGKRRIEGNTTAKKNGGHGAAFGAWYGKYKTSHNLPSQQDILKDVLNVDYPVDYPGTIEQMLDKLRDHFGTREAKNDGGAK